MAVELPVVESRPNPWMTGLAASPFAILIVLAVVAMIAGNPLFLIPAPHMLFLGLFATIWNRFRRPFPRMVSAQARVDAEGLTITDGNGEQQIDAASITSGVKVPTPTGSAVRLTQKGAAKRELHVASDADADTLLEALGLDVRTTSATFRGMPRTFTSMWRLYGTIFGSMFGLMIASLTAAAVHIYAAPVVALTGMLAVALLMLWPSRIDVGGDGVLVRWLGRERFIPHDQIERVWVQQKGFGNSKWENVELTLTGGEKFQIPSSRLDKDAARILAQRILDAKKAAASGGVAPRAMLQRSERSFSEWVAALRRRDVTDLRSPAVPKDHLWPVIEDAASDALERAAAVIALGRDLGDKERVRLKRVAKVTAAPKLRVVLEEAPDAEEEELVKMLEEVETLTREA